MSNSIPDFATRISLLNDVLEDAYSRSGKRTKRSIKNIALSNLSWGTNHVKVFEELQDTLRNAVKLSHPKPEMEICVYTDASDRFWSAVVTQTRPASLNLPLDPMGNRDMFLTKCGYNCICPFVIPTISFLCPNFI